MLKERYIMGGAIAVSIIIHLATVPLYDKLIKKIAEKKPEPIEVSYFPKEDKPVEPPPTETKQEESIQIPAYIPDFIDNTDRETTLDKTEVISTEGVLKDDRIALSEQMALLPNVNTPKPTPQLPIIEEKDDNPILQPETFETNETDEISMQDTKPAEEPFKPNTAGLFDTKEVVEEIANRPKEQLKGQDTASYNKFESKYASYFAKFKNNVYQIWNYPEQSVLRGETGIVKVTFSILKDGSIVNIKLLGTSGYPALDREVMRVLKNMRRTPLPSSYELDQLNVDDANFIYTIDRGWDIF